MTAHQQPAPARSPSAAGAGATLHELAANWDTWAGEARDLAREFQANGLTHTEMFIRGQAAAASACANALREALAALETP